MKHENGSLARQDLLAEALFNCLQAVEAGASPQDVRDRYPEFAAEVAEFLADRERFEHLATPLRQAVQAAPLPVSADLGTLGDFRLLREVGKGGMGIVYEAEQL